MFKKMPIPFLIILATGIVLGLIFGFKSMIPYLYWGDMKEYVWYRSALPHIINYLFWPLLVPLIYLTFDRFNIGRGAGNADRFFTLVLSLVIPFAHEFFTTLIYFLLLAGLDIFYFSADTWPQVKAAFPGVYIGRVVEFWIIYGLFASFEYYRKYKDKQAELGRIEAQLNRTKLEVLKMQLQPHFLFNALNTISGLMEIDVKKAQLVTARLGDLLRGILEHDARLFVSLQEELKYVHSYLDIEKVRFEDRLIVKLDVDADAYAFQVPQLIVQPLVENAIKHGVAHVSHAVEVSIGAHVRGDELVISVSDNAVGYSGNQEKLFKQGIGLQNIKERLWELYHGASSMHIETGENKGFTVNITIPKLSEHANH